MTRGLGTALGVSLVALAPHLGGWPEHAATGVMLAMVVLAATALLAAGTGRAAAAEPCREPPTSQTSGAPA